MTQRELETRLLKLEHAVLQLQSRVDAPVRTDSRWWVTDAGRFADDPVFDEIAELGEKYRKSLKPKRRKASRGDS